MVPGDRVLIVSADDYGLTPGVCSGILRAHEQGVVTSTSVLAVAPASSRWAGALRDSGLDPGVHLALVGEDPPLLAPREIPSLVDHRGRFPLTWRAFVARAVRGQIDPGDVRRELVAQFECVTGAGIRPTHVDCHQNLQLWPAVGELAMEVARSRGIRAIRVLQSRRCGPRAWGVRVLSPALRRRAATAGFVHPGASAGFDEAGRLGGEALRTALGHLAAAPAQVVEISTHPGEAVDPARSRYRWSYEWPAELRALCDPHLRSAIDRAGFRLGSFEDLLG